MIITLCNGKGGSGKTTLSVLLGSALVEAGHHVALLDTDPQHTATRWIEEIGGLELATAGKEYGALFIDTAPRLETREVKDSIRRADVVVLVTSPSPADLFTSRDTASLIHAEGAKDRAFVLFNQVQPGTILARDLEDMAARIGLPAFKNTLRRRQAYQHAVLMGWKSLGNEAREELFKVALEIVGSIKTQSSKAAKKDKRAVGQ
ncbi:MAG: AAA family ATPase [Janthinobacterium lividum]